MSEAQRHRGPNDQGMYVLPGERGGIVNCRLAIRDLSAAGHMPMGNEPGTLWITYNGEIYNTDELRTQLERAGCVFRSTSDTEVILHGYAVWGGEELVKRLRGIFAFAILDLRPSENSPVLFLVRDRLGVKPLYYAQTADAFLFASEIKGMRASGLVSSEVSAVGLVSYLLMGCVADPYSIYRSIRSLQPGHMLTLELGGIAAMCCPVPYWTMPVERDDAISTMDAIDQVRGLLEETVRTHLVSDVPLGAFLSGGMDSSGIVALTRKATSGTIRTCSMVFAEEEYDEAMYARAMADAVGAEHYERVITPADLTNEIDRIWQAMDQPTADGINTYFVSQTAREAGLTVSLSGLGGDELFGGYENIFVGVPRMLTAIRAAHLVPGASAVAARAITILPQRHRWAKLQGALTRPATPESMYFARRGLFSPAQVQSLVSPEVWDEAAMIAGPTGSLGQGADAEEAAASFATGPFAWNSRAELSTYVGNQLLRDTDVLSMAHSLEVRVPFLDHRLVEAVLRLPPRVHRVSSGPKPLLAAALGEDLPPIIRERRDKQGFTFPFERWMQPLRGQLRRQETSGDGSVPGLRAGTIDRMWQLHAQGRINWSRPWALTVLENWAAVQNAC